MRSFANRLWLYPASLIPRPWIRLPNSVCLSLSGLESTLLQYVCLNPVPLSFWGWLGGLPISGHRNILFFRCSVIDILYFDEDEYPGVSHLFLELLLKPFGHNHSLELCGKQRTPFSRLCSSFASVLCKNARNFALIVSIQFTCVVCRSIELCNLQYAKPCFIVHNVYAYFWSQMIREVVSCKFSWKLVRHSETSEAMGLYFSGIELHKVQILLKLAFG